jgi:hypothetical protein
MKHYEIRKKVNEIMNDSLLSKPEKSKGIADFIILNFTHNSDFKKMEFEKRKKELIGMGFSYDGVDFSSDFWSCYNEQVMNPDETHWKECKAAIIEAKKNYLTIQKNL